MLCGLGVWDVFLGFLALCGVGGIQILLPSGFVGLRGDSLVCRVGVLVVALVVWGFLDLSFGCFVGVMLALLLDVF